MSNKKIRIAIDCMGGDIGLSVTVPAALLFAKRYPDVHCLLVGEPQAIEQTLRAQGNVDTSWYDILPASEVVTMADSVEVALRRKKDSSMRVAAQSVKDGIADACISAGNTGAWMAISRYVLKTLDGIDRPAIATSIPNQKGGATIMLDLGANVDCSAEHLLQFAIMGSALASIVDRHERPTVGLLNIGEEVIKGNEVVKKAAELLRSSGLNFYGNVEGDDICKGTVNVVVCDGFVGNVVLKSIEGLAKMVGSMLRDEFTRDPLSKVSALLARPVLNRFRDRVDNRRHNGAALLGLRGIVIKSHGSADAYAFGYALQRARDAVLNGLLSGTSQAVERIMQSVSLHEEQSGEPDTRHTSEPSSS
ncbi:phosphate acyltransferase PlsX [Alcaligenes faecalis]|uniref:phosphate acyltransferase PlsX n=1 Tax=Alcaligenes faecalis TaxID=511 RepID=UPI0012940DB0|nr:phosphate acyltransferase PlsX [Alcaligenes faecalis]MBX6963267.1 phosphate acyltransferase PlsX [Providencia rettgeri]MBX7029917.1 phosphate acyltransferase PlsX [Alcaligenes faecalis]QFY78591.1 phosphate acyltransferase PlsX [Alcaligenes faecalis]